MQPQFHGAARACALLVVLSSVCCLLQDAKCAPTDSMETTTEPGLYGDTRKRSKGFACKTPQPRAFVAHDMIENYKLGAGEQVMPNMVVLHRCNGNDSMGFVGCCKGNGVICTMHHYEEVELVVKIVQWKDGSCEYKTIKERNHTSCACKHKNAG